MENLEVGPRPKVSIGFPIYNGERFVRGALDMIAAQTYRDYELVIIDNGSTDASGAICQEYAQRDPRIKYFRFEGTIPIVNNFWRAFLHTRGEYFLWQAADDRRAPDTIARAVAELDRHPEAVMVHGPIELDIVATGKRLTIANDFDASSPDPRTRIAAYVKGMRHNGIIFSIYRREALARAKFRQHVGQDYLCCLQMAMIGPMRRLDGAILRYWHVFGPLDDPIGGRRPVSIRELLAWPSNRFKASIVLVRGCIYLMGERQTPLGTRVASTVTFVRTYLGRYISYIANESLLALAAPAGWAMWPLTEPARRLRRAWMRRRGPASSAPDPR